MCIQAVLISHRAGTGPYLYQLVYNVSHQADESTRPGLGPQLVRGFKTARAGSGTLDSVLNKYTRVGNKYCLI